MNSTDKTFKTPMVWNITVYCDMSIKAADKKTALKKAAELGNDKAFLTAVMGIEDDEAVKISSTFNGACLYELREVC